MTDEERLAAEQRARVLIDRQLTEARWVVQVRKDLNLFAGQGEAVREVIMAKGQNVLSASRLLLRGRFYVDANPCPAHRVIHVGDRGVDVDRPVFTTVDALNADHFLLLSLLLTDAPD
jgi:hypothetical protein